MPYRKKTLRAMTPTGRKLAKLQGEIDSIARRMKSLVSEVNDIEATLRVATGENNRHRAALLETEEARLIVQEIATKSLFSDLLDDEHQPTNGKEPDR